MPDPASVSPPPPDEAAPFDAADTALRALLSGISGGDQADLAALYDATSGRLHALALRIVGDRGGAEEVLSDVYMQVWQQAARYDPRRGKVMSWLFMICRSRALDCLRRRDPVETASEPEVGRREPESAGAEPLDVLQGLERSHAIRAALETLKVQERQLLALAFFRDMSHQDLAEYTGLPLGSVKTVLRRALESLRRQLPDAAGKPGGRHGE